MSFVEGLITGAVAGWMICAGACFGAFWYLTRSDREDKP